MINTIWGNVATGIAVLRPDPHDVDKALSQVLTREAVSNELLGNVYFVVSEAIANAVKQDQLTPPERDVLALMAEGRNQQWDRHPALAHRPDVQPHVTSIMSRLGLRGSADEHRRVLAVLTWMGVRSAPVGPDRTGHADRR